MILSGYFSCYQGESRWILPSPGIDWQETKTGVALAFKVFQTEEEARDIKMKCYKRLAYFVL